MVERLIIKDFAGIQSLEMDVQPINLIIDPQASGKSICAKLLFYFKGFPQELLAAAESGQTKSKLDANYIKLFETYFPPESWGN